FYLSGTRIARVEETRIVALPGDAGGASTSDLLRKRFACGGLNHLQSADFGSALRCAKAHIFSIVRGVPPIQRRGSVCGHRVHIDQRTVFAVQSLAHVKYGLVAIAVTAFVKVEVLIWSAALTDLRSAYPSDAEQLLQARVDLGASLERVEHGPRVREFI